MIDLASIIGNAIMITIFVFTMMLLVDYINVITKGKMQKKVKGGIGRQYIIASFLGSTPGCLGAFMNVSFYVHGLITFGAIVGGMIATCGDEAFVMLARKKSLPHIQKRTAKEAVDFLLKNDFCNPHQLVRTKKKVAKRKKFFQELFDKVPVFLLNTVETPTESLARLKNIADEYL